MSPAATTLPPASAAPPAHPVVRGGGVFASGPGNAAAVPAAGSVAALLTANILRDGEIILLVLKPSRWFIALSSLPFILGLTGAVILLYTVKTAHAGLWRLGTDLALLLAAGRIMWAAMVWMSRLYILTDLRLLRISGVLTADVYDCPLRKIGRTRVLRPVRERVLRLGTILIVPADREKAVTAWQTLARPDEVEQMIHDAIKRSRGTGSW